MRNLRKKSSGAVLLPVINNDNIADGVEALVPSGIFVDRRLTQTPLQRPQFLHH
jgi:hypothetical protein